MFHYKTKLLWKKNLDKNTRILFNVLKDNCDACENKGNMKPYTPEELQGHKENLQTYQLRLRKLQSLKSNKVQSTTACKRGSWW